MATGNVNLTVNGQTFAKQKVYNNKFENTQEVDNTDGFIIIDFFLSVCSFSVWHNSS